jgi:hypothetical protein
MPCLICISMAGAIETLPPVSAIIFHWVSLSCVQWIELLEHAQAGAVLCLGLGGPGIVDVRGDEAVASFRKAVESHYLLAGAPPPTAHSRRRAGASMLRR